MTFKKNILFYLGRRSKYFRRV